MRARGRTLKVVTLEVSQLEMSSLKAAQEPLHPYLAQYEFGFPQKTHDRSVTCATFHPLMWPYITAAAVGLAHQSCTAVSSAARSTNTFFGGESGGGEDGGGNGGNDGVAAAAVAAAAAARDSGSGG